MAYNNTYGWNRPFFNNGNITRWFSILKAINENGPMTKRQLLVKVWNKHFTDDSKWVSGEGWIHRFIPLATAKNREGAWRGNNSHLFACMHADNLIEYNPDTYSWELGWFGKVLLSRYSA